MRHCGGILRGNRVDEDCPVKEWQRQSEAVAFGSDSQREGVERRVLISSLLMNRMKDININIDCPTCCVEAVMERDSGFEVWRSEPSVICHHLLALS